MNQYLTLLGLVLSPVSLRDFLGDRGVVDIDTIDIPASLDSLLWHRNSITILPQQDLIAAHVSLPHLPRLAIKGPIFQAIASLPLHAVVFILEFIPELHRDLVVGECEQLLAKAVGLFFLPLVCQEIDDLVSAPDE